MSDRTQRTAATMRENMLRRYDDDFHHKHDKCHLPYRMHWPSHPHNKTHLSHEQEQTPQAGETSSQLGKRIVKKTRLRIVKHRSH